MEVEASPETVWALLTDHNVWPSFYPGAQQVRLLDGHDRLRLGTRFETNLAGQDVTAAVTEFEPISRIAWTGGPTADSTSRAHPAWIITPSATSTHLWTEETMQGPLWLELAKPAPDIFWRTHETLLRDFARIAVERERT